MMVMDHNDDDDDEVDDDTGGDKKTRNIRVGTRMGGCHRPWYWREIYPDYGASS